MSVDGYKKGKTRRQRAQLRLHRGIDGRLKSSAESDDIGDIWAQQERIRLAQLIEEDQRRKNRQNIKKKRGLVGVAKKDIGSLKSKLRTGLFGEEVITKSSSKKHPKIKKTKSKNTTEIHVTIPAVNLRKPEVSDTVKDTVKVAARKTTSTIGKSMIAFGLLAGVVAIIGVGTLIFHMVYEHYHGPGQTDYGASNYKPANLNATQKPPQQYAGRVQNPNVIKLLPQGKTIDEFGGWYSSNIAKIGNLYNYKDKINGVTVVVGQQSLTGQATTNPGVIAQDVANYFGANNLVMANGINIYIGTSKQDFQTIVFAKNDTLVLIGAGGKLSDATWTAYANALQPSS